MYPENICNSVSIFFKLSALISTSKSCDSFFWTKSSQFLFPLCTVILKINDKNFVHFYFSIVIKCNFAKSIALNYEIQVFLPSQNFDITSEI